MTSIRIKRSKSLVTVAPREHRTTDIMKAPTLALIAVLLSAAAFTTSAQVTGPDGDFGLAFRNLLSFPPSSLVRFSRPYLARAMIPTTNRSHVPCPLRQTCEPSWAMFSFYLSGICRPLGLGCDARRHA